MRPLTSGLGSGFYLSFSSLLCLPASTPPSFLHVQEASSFCDGVNIPFEVKPLGPLLYLVQDPAKGQINTTNHSQMTARRLLSIFAPFTDAISNSHFVKSISLVLVSLRCLRWRQSLAPERTGPCTIIIWVIHSSSEVPPWYKWLRLRKTALNIQKHSVRKKRSKAL